MKNLLKILVPIFGLSFGISSYANAQSNTLITKYDSVITEYSNNKDTKSIGDSIFGTKEYEIEKIKHYNKGNLVLETERKLSFIEKNIGNPGEPRNLINRKQIDEFLEYMKIYEHKYDSLGRLTETEKTENSSPEKGEIKKTKTYYTYEGTDKTLVRIWEDLNNDGKRDEKDGIKVYIKELDKWISQGE